MGNAEWQLKLDAALDRCLGEDAAAEILDGCAGLAGMDEKGKAAYVTTIMDRLDARIPDQQTKIEIMTECSCRCYGAFIGEFQQEYRSSGDIDKLIELMYGRVFLVRPVREGNIVYITKAPRFPEKHARAKTAEEKKYHFCHCDYARAASADISRTYCLCGAGWCKRIWEEVLGRSVQVDIVKSVLQGDEVCQFAVHL